MRSWTILAAPHSRWRRSSPYQEFKRRRSQIADDIALEQIENAFSIAQERSYYQKRSVQKDLTRLHSIMGAVAVLGNNVKAVVDAGLIGEGEMGPRVKE